MPKEEKMRSGVKPNFALKSSTVGCSTSFDFTVTIYLPPSAMS